MIQRPLAVAVAAALLATDSLGAQRPALRDSAWVDAADTKLFLDLRGNADGKAVILFLHGGPGGALFGLLSFIAYAGPALEPDYAMAYLHQRGVLRSPAVPDSAQTFDRHVDDVDRVVTYLARRFPNKPLIVAGHSWGGFLTTLYATRRPTEPVAGFVVMTAPASFTASERAGYDSALAWATRTRNDTALRQLEELGPGPQHEISRMLRQRRWVARTVTPVAFDFDVKRALAAGGYTTVDPTWEATGDRISTVMGRSILATDLRPYLPRMTKPLLAIAGGQDPVVLPGPMMEHFDGWGGPKRLVVFQRSDHMVFGEEPERFREELRAFVDSLRR